MASRRVARQIRTCKYCGTTFTRKPSYTNRRGKTAQYCSHAHYIAYIKSPQYFWSLVIKTEDCWLWTGYLNPMGYGQIRWSRKMRAASRVAYELTHGPIASPKIMVRHKCDNPPCVRPDHLEIGTAADNSRDMTDRGRQSKGEARYNAKLNADKVRSMRREYKRRVVTLNYLAQKHGISIATAGKVVNRQVWTHVE